MRVSPASKQLASLLVKRPSIGGASLLRSSATARNTRKRTCLLSVGLEFHQIVDWLDTILGKISVFGPFSQNHPKTPCCRLGVKKWHFYGAKKCQNLPLLCTF